jgi:hypothetical protein
LHGRKLKANAACTASEAEIHLSTRAWRTKLRRVGCGRASVPQAKPAARQHESMVQQVGESAVPRMRAPN